MSLVGLLLLLVFLCIIAWAARAILNAFSIPDPIRTVVWVVIVLVCVLVAIDQLGGIGGGPVLRLR